MQYRPTKKRGETVFAGLMVALSAGLLWQAYKIAGFEALSSPGAFPMAVAAIMLISAFSIFIRALRTKTIEAGNFWSTILPPLVVVMMGLVAGYAALLQPLGFLPTSLLFLTGSIWVLRKRGLVYSVTVSVLSLVGIYVIFRLVFSVLMPAGIVPEGEILAWFGNLFTGETK